MDKIIDPSGPFAICPECGYKHRFVYLPLFVVSGASCSGKTTVLQQLLGHLPQAVLLDSDIIWRPEFNSPQTHYQDFFETWLRLCKNISQSGRPVILFGAGFGVPENIEPRVERRYFSSIEYLALTCDDQVLAERLRQRPAWRGTQDLSFIEAQLRFNQWFISQANAAPVIRLVDTTNRSIGETVTCVSGWFTEKFQRISNV